MSFDIGQPSNTVATLPQWNIEGVVLMDCVLVTLKIIDEDDVHGYKFLIMLESFFSFQSLFIY